MALKYSKSIKNRIASLWDDSSCHQSSIFDLIDSLIKDGRGLDTPFCSFMQGLDLSKVDDVDRMLTFEMRRPGDYSCTRSYYVDNLLNTLVKKYPHWDTSFNTKLEAMKTFISCEIKCQSINNRLRLTRTNWYRDDVASILSIARQKIALILGDTPDISSLDFAFGPGATFSVTGRTSAFDKLGGALDVTPESADLAVELLRHVPGWLSLHGINRNDSSRIRDCLTIIPGDRLTFVSKTAKIDRPIAIGPSINLLLQKGMGSFIRKRLKRFGIDLSSRPDLHRNLARLSSKTGDNATIDLSSASDTISYEIVKELLPYGWFSRLDLIRCHRYQIEDNWYEYHKFSAMGNGFTFELESLIFYAIAYAVAKYEGFSTKDVSAYGDDIITPTGSSNSVIAVLDYLGFTTNKEKTFIDSKFRESCGGDYLNGILVRGFYFKDYVRLRDIIRYRNYLYRTGMRYWLSNTWREIRKLLSPYEAFLAGPMSDSDDHIIFDDFDHGRHFNYVQMSRRKVHYPKRRGELVRVFMLYRTMHSDPNNLSELLRDTDEIVIRVARRN